MTTNHVRELIKLSFKWFDKNNCNGILSGEKTIDDFGGSATNSKLDE